MYNRDLKTISYIKVLYLLNKNLLPKEVGKILNASVQWVYDFRDREGITTLFIKTDPEWGKEKIQAYKNKLSKINIETFNNIQKNKKDVFDKFINNDVDYNKAFNDSFDNFINNNVDYNKAFNDVFLKD